MHDAFSLGKPKKILFCDFPNRHGKILSGSITVRIRIYDDTEEERDLTGQLAIDLFQVKSSVH